MRQIVLQDNGDTVEVEVPDPPGRRAVSAQSRDRLDRMKGFRQDFYRRHRRAPSGHEIHAAIKRVR